MTQDATRNSSTIPANKFYPPAIDYSHSLLRAGLLRAKFPHHHHDKKLIIIEAQAGQGKTTLAGQFLHANRYTSIWYQIDREDTDPVLLLSSLLMNLRANLPDFTSAKLATLLDAGRIGPADLSHCANIVLQDLDAYLKDDIYLVFDDLHRLEFGTLTNKLLEHLLDTSPPRIHFIFISRQPVEIRGTTIRNGSQIAYLSTADLALGSEDIEALYTNVLHKQISRQDAIKIEEVTSGWIMGIFLASHPISGRSRFWHQAAQGTHAGAPQSGHMLDFFEDEIFAQIPSELHESFLKFSFLQEIPVDLAGEISGIDNLGRVLTAMTRENFFIYHPDDRQQVFHLHHYFQEFLQQRARALFSQQQINTVLHQEGRYYQQHNRIKKALTSYKHSGNFTAMEDILRQKGLELINGNRTFAILKPLQSIPPATLCRHRWLTLFTGLLRLDSTPQTTLPFWDLAREQFARAHEATGEFIALCQTIYFYLVISGEYNKGAELLPRAEQLLATNRPTLPTTIIIMAAQNLAAGYCFFMGDTGKARHYIQLATTLTKRHHIGNFMAANRFIQGYIELVSGNRARYLRHAEVSFSLVSDPLVGTLNRLSLRVMHLCYLSMIGDHQNFSIQQLALQQSSERTLLGQTVATPYLAVWGSSNLFSLGRSEQGLQLLAKELETSAATGTNHMRSQLLLWQAFGHALLGNNKEAQVYLSKAGQVPDKTNRPFSAALSLILAGAVDTRINNFTQARHSLTEGLAKSQDVTSTYLTMCAHFHLSYCKLQADSAEAALDDLKAGLYLMKMSGYNHFWGWEPVMMTTLLALAVQKGIEKKFARNLAKTRLHLSFSKNGDPLPLLEIKLMDSFALSMAGKVLCRSKDLTPLQRELLGLLITARGQRIAQEKIQLELWPDSSPENARKSFDTLLTRLRKKLAPHLPRPVKEYLFLQKGILCLSNYDIDFLHFSETARAGLSHCKNGNFLQGHSAFQTAISLWHGAMPEDTFHSEQVLTCNDALAGLLRETGSTWARNLAETNMLDEAIAVLERILAHNYLEDSLTVLLHSFYCRNNNHLKAREILERYKKALLKAEYTADEAAAFIAHIIATTNY